MNRFSSSPAHPTAVYWCNPRDLRRFLLSCSFTFFTFANAISYLFPVGVRVPSVAKFLNSQVPAAFASTMTFGF